VATCGVFEEARQYRIAPGAGCHRSIANTGTRTAAGTKNGKSNPWRSRSRRKLLGRAQCRCPARTRFLAARSAARCSRHYPNRLGNVPSASSNSTPADSARISILRAASNARSLFPSGWRVRTSAISVRFIPCGFEWRRKLRHLVRLGRWIPGRRSRISSRSRLVWRGTPSSAFF
jgi:hypothetical protein